MATNDVSIRLLLKGSKEVLSELQGVEKGIGNFAKGAAAAAAAATVAGASIAAALTKSAIDSAEATGILAGKLGITTEALSKLQYAAKLSDVSQAALETGMKRLSRTLTDAAAGAGAGAKAFEALGLSAEQIIKLPADEQLGAIADALNRVSNASQKAALAQQIFGKGGMDMLPIIAEGSAGIKALGDEAERFGAVVSGPVAAQAQQFNDNLDRLKFAAQGLGLSLAEQALPVMVEFTDQIVALGQDKATMDGIAAGLSMIGEAAVTMAQSFGAAGAAIQRWRTTSLEEVQAQIVETVRLMETERKWYQNPEMRRNLDDKLAALMKQRDALKLLVVEQKFSNVESGHSTDAAKKEVAAKLEVNAVTRALTGSTRALTAAEKERREDEMLSIFQKAEADKGLYETKAAVEATTVAIAAQKTESDPWAEAMVHAVERIDASFADAWLNVGEGFDGVLEGMADALERWLAEMAHMLITKPLLANISAGITGGGGSGGVGGIGGLVSAARTGYGWLTGAGGTGFGIGASVGNVYGGLEDALGMLGIKTPGRSFGYAGATGLETLKGIGIDIGAGMAGSYLTSSLYGGRESTGYGSMAGGFVGSAFGPVGTFVGAAVGEAIDRALSGSDFSGKRVKLGIGTGSMVDGSDWENSRTLSSGLRVGNLTRRAGDAGLSDEQINTYLSAFDTIDATLASIARSAGATIDLSGQALPGMVQSYDGGTSGGAFFGSLAKGELRQQMQDAPAEFVRQWLDATAESFGAEVRPFLQRIDGTVEEMLGSFGAIIDIQSKYKASTEALKTLLGTDTIGLVTQQIADASRSLYQVWSDQGDAIVKFSTELADTADYAELTAMVQQRYATEIALIGQVMGALQQIDGIFAGTIEGIRLDLMGGNDERYAYFEQQIERLAGSLATMTDPGQILDTLKQIDTLAGRSYGLLDDTQKATIGEDIIGFLDQVQADADARLNALLSTVQADKQNEAGTVANAIQTALDGASSKMTAELEAVFAKQQQAADTLNNAANQFGGWVNYLPSTINVTFAASEVNA